MEYSKFRIYALLLSLLCLSLGSISNKVYADNTGVSLLDNQLSQREQDSLQRALIDEIFISKYLRFFDGSYKSNDSIILYQERPELQSPIPFYSNPDSVYRVRLDNLSENYIVKLPYNEKVRNYIDVYVNKRRKQVNVMLALSQYYFPIFEEAMEKEGLPKELKYLAIIESGLNPRAVSPAGASGIWQFMYQTGRMNNLRINTKVDERLDPEKASVAAARYLKELYRCFGDWTLAIAAYNCGPGNVNKAIRKAKGKTDFWDIYPFLPRETRGYIPAYIGATYVMNFYKEHGFQQPRLDLPILTDTLMMDIDIDMKQVAEAMNIPIQVLRDLNPQYKQDIIPGRTDYYSLRLPVNFIAEFLENKEAILSDTSSLNDPNAYGPREKVIISHRIKKGENLSSIAQRYRIKVSDLMAWNNLRNSLIYPNELLTIHISKQKASEIGVLTMVKPEPSKLETTSSNSNIGASGSALSITTTSSRSTANTSTTPTQTATNNTNSNGTDSLSSKSQNTSSTEKNKTKLVTYRVKKGDSLYSICKRHTGSIFNEIVSRNKLPRNGNLIYPNQELVIEIH